MENSMQLYEKWQTFCTLDTELQKELGSIKDNIEEIQDRFYKSLEFGTGGMRGLIGAGSNRMNKYTVGKATQGLANYLKKNYPESPEPSRVVIAYDTRYKSRDFALHAALVLANNGIRAFIFQQVAPTPLLSYAVRHLQAQAGIVITASHNPKEYNGYKVYAHHGGQVTDKAAHTIMNEIAGIENEFAIRAADQQTAENEGLLTWIDDEVLQTYLLKTKDLLINKTMLATSASQLKIVYSPLHGTGLVPITKLFTECGFESLHVVKEQAPADPAFPTLHCPNPEDEAACVLAVNLAQEIGGDIIMVTDPDADRIGVAVRDEKGHFIHLTGNQTGALLVDYILQMKQEQGLLPAKGVIIKTIVTSNLGSAIAARYGVDTIEVLTGFKYIGEKLAEFEEKGRPAYLFGYEESYGYLIGDYVRDKDAIQTALLISEMALHYKLKGLTLYQRLQELFAEYGYHQEDLINLSFPGLEGQERIGRIMEALRKEPPQELKNFGILAMRDYLTGKETNFSTGTEDVLRLPASNVLYYSLAGGSWCCIRPSGTEPKLKIYLASKQDTLDQAKEVLNRLKQAFTKLVDSIT